MKVRLLAVMAVVVVGVMAGTSPAMAQNAKTASSKSQWTKQHKDNVAFGGAIHTLRKQVDSTNGALTTITVAALEALTALKNNLTKVADATTNFKYGVVQVASENGATSTLGGVGPSHFFATPPIYKTGEQSTVTFSVPDLSTLSLAGAQPTNSRIKLLAAVRSVNPDSGTVNCKATVTQNGGAAATGTWVTWIQSSTKGIFVEMPQSRIEPQNGDKSFPYALVDTEDNVLDLADARYMAGINSVVAKSPSQARPNTTGGATVTFSCLVS